MRFRLTGLIFATTILPLFASQTQAGPIFTADIFQSNGIPNGISGSSPVDTLQESGVVLHVNGSSYTGRAAADQGILRARIAVAFSNTNESLYDTMFSRTGFGLDDLFITGPGGGPAVVQATMHVRVDGQMSAVGFNSGAGADLRLSLIAGGGYGGGGVSATLDGHYDESVGYGPHTSGLFAGESGYSIHDTFSVTATLHTTFANGVEVNFAAAAGSSNAGGGTASSDFFDTVHFPTAGPVFDLPEGYTANSVSGNIVDNHWVGVPEPTSAVLGLFAAAGMAVLAIRRRPRRRFGD